MSSLEDGDDSVAHISQGHLAILVIVQHVKCFSSMLCIHEMLDILDSDVGPAAAAAAVHVSTRRFETYDIPDITAGTCSNFVTQVRTKLLVSHTSLHDQQQLASLD